MNSFTRALRWRVKKVTRCGLAILSWGTGYLWLKRWIDPRPRVRVLTYHRFRPCEQDPFSVDVARFEEQMRWLARRRLAISLSDLEDFLAGRRALRNGAVLVTIDDGYEEVWSAAAPILQRYGVPAVAFVPAADVPNMDGVSRPSISPDDGPRLTVRQLTALREVSIEIGSHSWEHRSLGRMNAADANEQLIRSKCALEKMLGRSIVAFAYPYGTWRDFNATTTRLLGEAGYGLGFTSQHGSIAHGAEPRALPRIKVEGGERLWMFKLLVSGGLDSWRVVDRSLWWLQQSEVFTHTWAQARKSPTGAI